MKNFALLFVFVVFAFVTQAQMNKDSSYNVISGKDTTTVTPGDDIDQTFQPADSFKVLNTFVQKDKKGNTIDTIMKIKSHGKYFYTKKSKTTICYNADGTVDLKGPAADTDLPSTGKFLFLFLGAIVTLTASVFGYRRIC